MKTITTVIIFLCFGASSFAQDAGSNLKISHLTGDFYIFNTYNLYKGERIPANGMYLVTLITNNKTQTQKLIKGQ